MRRDIPLAEYDPCERASIRVIHRQASDFNQVPLLSDLCNGLPNIVLVLNAQRQIVFASKSFLEMAQISDRKKLLGLRPGEALGCLHAKGSRHGCGTTSACQQCGAARAILSGLSGIQAQEEFHVARLVRCGPQTLDLLVQATPLVHKNERFTLFAVTDIRMDMRRQVLEQLLFQEFLNSSSDLDELLSSLKANVPAKLKDRIEVTRHQLNALVDEVQTEKHLAAPEEQRIQVNLESIKPQALIKELVVSYQALSIAAHHRIEHEQSRDKFEIISDRALLKRILGLLLKDALESSPLDHPVRIGCQTGKKEITFWVHSQRFIPADVQLLLFHQRYSARGKGVLRNAYDARYLAEHHLQGRVDYESTPADGTSFRLYIPQPLKRGKRDKKTQYEKH